MKTEETAHSKARKRQRGITKKMQEVVLKYGEERRGVNSSSVLMMSEKRAKETIKQLQEEIKALKKCKNKAFVISEDGEVITAYNINKNRKINYEK